MSKNSVSKHVYITNCNFEALTQLAIKCNRSRSYLVSKFINYAIDNKFHLTRFLTSHDCIFSPYLTIKNECTSTILSIPNNILKRCYTYFSDYFQVCSFSYFLNHLIALCIGGFGSDFWVLKFSALKPSNNKFSNYNQVNYRKALFKFK